MKYSRRNILQSMGALAGASILPISADANQTERPPEDLKDIINLFDFEKAALGKMSKMAYEFVASGAADEFTVKWNREALDKLKIQTQVLNDVARLDTKVSLFGKEMPYPIMIAPTAFHKLMHPEGELATARAQVPLPLLML